MDIVVKKTGNSSVKMAALSFENIVFYSKLVKSWWVLRKLLGECAFPVTQKEKKIKIEASIWHIL